MATGTITCESARWLTVDAAASYSGLSVKTIRRLLAGGRLTAHRPVRGRVIVDRRQVDALLEGSTGSVRGGRGMRQAVTA